MHPALMVQWSPPISRRVLQSLGAAAGLAWAAVAGGAETVPGRTAPSMGIPVHPAARDELAAGVAALDAAIRRLERELPAGSRSRDLLPDVAVFHKAVAWPLRYGEFFGSNDVVHARRLLRAGNDRAAALARGETPWLTQTGLVLRGFKSVIDGSVQPYGLVVPPAWRPGGSWPVLVWLHGRDNHLTELKFLSDRSRSPGEFAPTNALVVHPYGRFCNAFKFAGEVDVFEALAHATASHGGDSRRTALAGFSMGGAGAWHLGAHHPSRWRFVSPGAGFAETADYTGILKKGPVPAPYVQTLWKWYDATAYAGNFFNTSLLAYSGEVDPQIQSARVMQRALQEAGLPLRHFVGPATAHRYEPATKRALATEFAAHWRTNQAGVPDELRFITFTLRYAEAGWLRLEGLQSHWRAAGVHARRLRPGAWSLTTSNVTALSVDPVALGGSPSTPGSLEIDGDTVAVEPGPGGDSRVTFARTAGRWQVTRETALSGKRPGVQGPIDDAFLDRFVMVRPTGTAAHPAVGAWVAAELMRATNEWRAQFRGEAPVVDDRDLADQDLGSANLVLWGDPGANRILARALDRLPLAWNSGQIRLGTETWPASTHLPVLIVPNPWNPRRYLVLNSGFTFAAAGDQSNALQTPRLPDFAIRDITREGTVVKAGFWDETWRLP